MHHFFFINAEPCYKCLNRTLTNIMQIFDSQNYKWILYKYKKKGQFTIFRKTGSFEKESGQSPVIHPITQM